jgi:hypothetical protein
MSKAFYESAQLCWRDLLIEVRYCPDWPPGRAAAGDDTLAHIEIETIEPVRAVLPLTETGYRSHFVAARAVSAAGGALAYVEQALNDAADDPRWKEREQAARQYSLF